MEAMEPSIDDARERDHVDKDEQSYDSNALRLSMFGLHRWLDQSPTCDGSDSDSDSVLTFSPEASLGSPTASPNLEKHALADPLIRVSTFLQGDQVRRKWFWYSISSHEDSHGNNDKLAVLLNLCHLKQPARIIDGNGHDCGFYSPILVSTMPPENECARVNSKTRRDDVDKVYCFRFVQGMVDISPILETYAFPHKSEIEIEEDSSECEDDEGDIYEDSDVPLSQKSDRGRSNTPASLMKLKSATVTLTPRSTSRLRREVNHAATSHQKKRQGSPTTGPPKKPGTKRKLPLDDDDVDSSQRNQKDRPQTTPPNKSRKPGARTSPSSKEAPLGKGSLEVEAQGTTPERSFVTPGPPSSARRRTTRKSGGGKNKGGSPSQQSPSDEPKRKEYEPKYIGWTVTKPFGGAGGRGIVVDFDKETQKYKVYYALEGTEEWLTRPELREILAKKADEGDEDIIELHTTRKTYDLSNAPDNDVDTGNGDVIEEILEKEKTSRGTFKYLVRYTGMPSSSATWVREADVPPKLRGAYWHAAAVRARKNLRSSTGRNQQLSHASSRKRALESIRKYNESHHKSPNEKRSKADRPAVEADPDIVGQAIARNEEEKKSLEAHDEDEYLNLDRYQLEKETLSSHSATKPAFPDSIKTLFASMHHDEQASPRDPSYSVAFLKLFALEKKARSLNPSCPSAPENWEDVCQKQNLQLIKNSPTVASMLTIFESAQSLKVSTTRSENENSVDKPFRYAIFSGKISSRGFELVGPQIVNRTHRVARKFGSHRLLTVMMAKGESPQDTAMARNVLRRLMNESLNICGRSYRFLAAKEEKFFFFAEKSIFPGDLKLVIPTQYVRDWMGDYTMCPSVAKIGARMGLSFSPGFPTVVVSKEMVKIVDDIENKPGNLMTDGSGLISRTLAERVFERYKEELARSQNEDANVLTAHVEVTRLPTVFQIRLLCPLGGFKGTLVVTDSLKGEMIHLRPSLHKYGIGKNVDPSDMTLDVLNITQCPVSTKASLNRMTCLLISSLSDGKLDKYMYELADEAKKTMEDTTLDRNVGSISAEEKICRMLYAGFDLNEPFLQSLLATLKNKMMASMRDKAKIPCPDSVYLMGVPDTSGKLKPGECYVKLTRDPWVIDSQVLVTRSPSVHPGDVRILKAITSPTLDEQLGPDCIFFPVQGDRAHADEMSGGDYDGDRFFVSWNMSLIKHCKQVEPFALTSEVSAQMKAGDGTAEDIGPKKVSGDEIPRDDPKKLMHILGNHFVKCTVDVQFMIGKTANLHLAHADKSGVVSQACHDLAALYYVALDAGKSGEKVDIPSSYKTNAYPDFMKSKTVSKGKTYYESKSILGHLYRMFADNDLETKIVIPADSITIDPVFQEVVGDNRGMLAAAKEMNAKYKKEVAEMIGRLDEEGAYKILQQRYRAAFMSEISKFAEDAPHKIRALAAAYYVATYDMARSKSNAFSASLSFCWNLCLDHLCQIKCTSGDPTKAPLCVHPSMLPYL